MDETRITAAPVWTAADLRPDPVQLWRARAACRCGQLTAHGIDRTCGPCQARDKAPQGEAVKLFEPAPTQLAGQTALDMGAADGLGTL
jgi:hypothetical protein